MYLYIGYNSFRKTRERNNISVYILKLRDSRSSIVSEHVSLEFSKQTERQQRFACLRMRMWEQLGQGATGTGSNWEEGNAVSVISVLLTVLVLPFLCQLSATINIEARKLAYLA